MTARRVAHAVLAVALGVGAVLVPGVGRAQTEEYTLETVATYTVEPAAARVAVAVEMTFTNTTPDPEGQFSVFSDVRLAVHPGATEVTASDDEGDLDVTVADDDGVNVATIELREDVRFEESLDLELRYLIPDGSGSADAAGGAVRIGPSLFVFPAWGFGTASEVRVAFPAGFEMRVDGDELTEATGGTLTSGPIEDPATWLARVTGVGPAEYQSFEATVPLQGGTADLLVRSFADDPEWGQATLDLAIAALPRLEEEVGLPYPLLGRLVITQGVPSDESGFGETLTRRAEIVVAYDQPPFTILHQLAHVWLPPTLVGSRWIREGMASDLAARLADELEAPPPFDPATEAEELADAAFPLETWSDGSDPSGDDFGRAASWAFVSALRAEIGADAFRSVLARTAGSIGAYDGTQVDPPAPDGGAPRQPLTGRSLLDQLEAVTEADLSDAFADRVLSEADAALLPARREGRAAYASLVEAADGWGAPDPVRAAMTAWDFGPATERIAAARDWLDERDRLLADMARVGLVAPDRLQQAYLAYGGGPEAVDELEAQRGVVDAYAAAAERINAPRSFLARVGLVGAADPSAHLNLANGHFADGDLTQAQSSIADALRVLDGAETAGLVRLISLAVLVAVLVGLAIAVFGRRASYTAPQ